MKSKTKNTVLCIVMGIFVFGFALLCLFLPKPDYLDSERRAPAPFPALTLDSVTKDGNEYGDSFMKHFDDNYAPDNFPFRDTFRSLKGAVVNYVFRQRDKDGIFMADGYVAEMQETIDEASLAHAAERLRYIYERYLKDKGIRPYLSVIPDKAYFLAAPNGYPSMDYDAFINKLLESTPFAQYIDITDSLSIEDYYKTDTHWRQERLPHVAALLVNGMGGNYTGTYESHTLDHPFYGVYSGRVGRPVPPESLSYLTHATMDSITVFDHENNKQIALYDMAKATGKDPYDIFLSGELSMVTIENPEAKTDRELIVFRDSFGRSLIPLLTEDYKKITAIDIRYLSGTLLGNFIEFDSQDVLFLYSTLVLNNSGEMK